MPSNIVPQRVPMVDPKTGMISREWYNFFLTLFELTGAGADVMSLADIQLAPPVVVSGWTPPIGMVAFFPRISVAPAGWTEYTPLRDKFPRGMPLGGTPGATGGSDTHSHGPGTLGTGAPDSTVTGLAASGSASAAHAGHRHSITTGTTSSDSHVPSYVYGLWCEYTG